MLSAIWATIRASANIQQHTLVAESDISAQQQSVCRGPKWTLLPPISTSTLLPPHRFLPCTTLHLLRCMGVSARSTGRTSRLDKFIRTGADQAMVQVVLCNQGEDAYKPDV